MKGPNLSDELEHSKNTITILGSKVHNIVEYQIEEFTRTIIDILKEENTSDKYPRKYNKIKSKPL